jgi:hypothetical protein
MEVPPSASSAEPLASTFCRSPSWSMTSQPSMSSSKPSTSIVFVPLFAFVAGV